MTKVLVLGANGQLARNTIPFLLQSPDVFLTLYLRRANRLKNPDPSRVTLVEGDVLDGGTLRTAMRGQGVVYANLGGAMAQQARAIIDAMHAEGVKRLIFISSMHTRPRDRADFRLSLNEFTDGDDGPPSWIDVPFRCCFAWKKPLGRRNGLLNRH